MKSQTALGKISPQLNEVLLIVHALIPSSAGVERVFSTKVHIHADTRNRLPAEKITQFIFFNELLNQNDFWWLSTASIWTKMDIFGTNRLLKNITDIKNISLKFSNMGCFWKHRIIVHPSLPVDGIRWRKPEYRLRSSTESPPFWEAFPTAPPIVWKEETGTSLRTLLWCLFFECHWL